MREARHFRRSRSRTKTEIKEDPEANVEKSVRGRSIVVLHNKDKPETSDGGQDGVNGKDESDTTSESTQARSHHHTAPFHRDIIFADEVTRQEDRNAEASILPQQISPEQHIAIRENQRNPKDKKALRIPGPRDFDRGREPEPLDDNEDGGDATQTASPRDNALNNNVTTENKCESSPLSHLKPNTAAFPKLSKRKSDLKDMTTAPTEEIQPLSARLRARTGTFSSLKEWASKENSNTVAPYLSWQPTIGRNSAFVDLTEEQREEL